MRKLNSFLIIVFMLLVGQDAYAQVQEPLITLAEKHWAEYTDDLLEIMEYSSHIKHIAIKWRERTGNWNVATHLAFNAAKTDAYVASKYYNLLIAHHEYPLAQQFSEDILSYWIQASGEATKENILDQFRFAYQTFDARAFLLLNQKYPNFLDQIKEKQEKKIKQKYEEYVRFTQLVPLHTSSSSSFHSIANILANTVYIDPYLLKIYGLTIDTVRETLRAWILELQNKDIVLFELLNTLAIYTVEHPSFRIQISQPGGEFLGTYTPLTRVSNIKILPSTFYIFKGIFMHELTHQVMDILYDNLAKPFKDTSQEQIYLKMLEKLQENLENIKELETYHSASINEKIYLKVSNLALKEANALIEVRKFYDIRHISREFAVLYPQTLATGTYSDEQVQQLYQPLVEYWHTYILPDIKAYTQKHKLEPLFYQKD